MSAENDATSIAAINEADETRAAQLILPFIERSPLLAARVARRRPFASPHALADAVAGEIAALAPDERIALFCGHPELAPSAPAAMTDASQREQGRMRLDAPDPATRARLAGLNRRYLDTYGFPFIIALYRHRDMASVLDMFEQRLAAGREAEIATASDEIAAVSRARILAAFGREPASTP